ncbi:cholesterol 24-hydroxylase-like [Diadema antillarum]|uniref:cholesterol 24-hydroxylase-like n=1 Tax=Diadema antillarum TaxID=105358 RepID=UPI003A86985E
MVLQSLDVSPSVVLGYALAATVALISSLFVAFVAYVQVQDRKYKHIPGPKRTSVVYGSLHEVRQFLKAGKTKLDLLMKWQSEYGTVFKYSLLHRYIIAGLDPDVVKEMLGRSIHWKPHRPYGIMGTVLGHRFMGNGLITEADHSRWKVHRSMLNPAFHRRYLMDLVDVFNQSADHLVDHLMKKADGLQEVSMYDAFNNISLDIIAKVTFNLELNALDDPDVPFPRAIMTCLNAVMDTINNPWMKYGLTKKHRQLHREVKEACELLRRTGRDCILARLEAKARGEHLPTDMLTSILDASQNLTGDKEFGMEQILDEFVTFFIAGQETTSNLMSFTLEMLGKHPDVLAKVEEELEEKLGSQMFVSFQDMSKLDYLSMVLKEALRLYAPASIVTRVAGCDVRASSGIVIPKGSQVNLSPFAMGRMPQYFDDPEAFRPERFDQRTPSPCVFFPFGYGQRTCIGQNFALIEARIIMAKILRMFRFELVPGQSWDLAYAVTIRPVDGCKNYISLRH